MPSPDRRCHIQTAPGATTWANISAWVDWRKAQESERSLGMVSSYSLPIWNKRPGDGAAIPVQPIGGLEIIWGDYAGGPGAIDYWGHGKVSRLEQDPAGSDRLDEVIKVAGVGRDELNVGWLEWSTDAQTDKDELAELFGDTTLHAHQWDATTHVQGPFVYHGATPPLRTYFRTNVYNVVRALAKAPPNRGGGLLNGTGVTDRRWHITGRWADEANPGAAGNWVVRVLHWYEASTGPQERLGITNRGSGRMRLVYDDFNRAADPAAPGTGPSGHTWVEQVGQWAVAGNQMLLSSSAGGNNVAYVESYVSDCEVQATFATLAAGQRLAFRVTPGGAGGWDGYVVQKGGGADYALFKYSGGAYTLLSGFIAGAANGDVIEAILQGPNITIRRNGATIITASDSFNQTATKHGLAQENASSTVRWDDFSIVGTGLVYRNWRRILDYTAMCNIVPISGPAADPFLVAWQNPVNVEHAAGLVRKKAHPAWQADHDYELGDTVQPPQPNGRDYTITEAGTSASFEPPWASALNEGDVLFDGSAKWETRTWNSGADSKEPFTADGGRVEFSIRENAVASDLFNRPNADMLGLADTGQDWAVYGNAGATWGVRGNRARLLAAAGAVSEVMVDSGVGTCIVQVQIPVAGVGAGLAARFSDGGVNGYIFRQEASDYRLYKRVAGSSTLVATIATAPSANDILKLHMVDNAIHVYLGSAGATPTFRTTYTDAFNAGATLHGLYSNQNIVAEFDAFRVWQTYTSKIVGFRFGDSNDGVGYGDIDYGIRVLGQAAQAIEAGTLRASAVAANVGDTFRVEARKRVPPGMSQPQMYISYWRFAAGGDRWEMLYESLQHPTVDEATPLRVGTSHYHTGATANDVQARRYTYTVYSDDASIALYGPYWAKEMVEDDALDSDDKRRALALGIFARYAYPRDTLLARMYAPLTPGNRVLVENTRLGWGTPPVLRFVASVHPDRTRGRASTGVFPWELELGDSPWAYGDDEPLGAILRAPDRDLTGPAIPAGFATGPLPGFRDGLTSVAQPFQWNRPDDDTRTVEVEVYRDRPTGGDLTTGELPDAEGGRHSFPATWLTGIVPRLHPGVLYYARIRGVDANGNRSMWSNPIDFTTVAIVRLPAPTGLTETGNVYDNQTGSTAVSVSYTPPGTDETIGGYMATITQGTHVVTLLLGIVTAFTAMLLPGEAYSAVVQTLDSYGLPGDRSVPLTGTAVGPVVHDSMVPNSSFEYLDRRDLTLPLYWSRSVLGNATAAIENSDSVHGRRSVKLVHGTTANTDTAGIISAPYAVAATAGDSKTFITSAWVKGAAGGETFALRTVYKDRLGNILHDANYTFTATNDWVYYETPAYTVFGTGFPIEEAITQVYASVLSTTAETIYVDAVDHDEIATGDASGLLSKDDKIALDVLIAGGSLTAPAFKTSAFTVDDTATVYLVSASGGAYTATLPTAVGRAGRQYTFKKLAGDTNKITIACSGGQNIDALTTFPLVLAQQVVTLVSDGANWRVLHSANPELRSDGSRWLGVEMPYPFTQFAALAPFKLAGGAADVLWAPPDTLRDLWPTRWDVNGMVSTTNSGSHYWNIILYRRTSGGSYPVVAQVTTAAWTPGDWDRLATVTSFSNVPVVTGDDYLLLNVAPTNSPGDLFVGHQLWVCRIYS